MLLLFIWSFIATASAKDRPVTVPGFDREGAQREADEICRGLKRREELATHLLGQAMMLIALEEAIRSQKMDVFDVQFQVNMTHLRYATGVPSAVARTAGGFDQALTEAYVLFDEEQDRLHVEVEHLLEESWGWKHDPWNAGVPRRQLRARCRASFARLIANAVFTYHVVEAAGGAVRVPAALYRDALYEAERNPVRTEGI